MLVRPYTESDLDTLRRMHASQGFDYPFPDLADPIFVSKLIVEDDHGRPAMASLARLTCEMYLLIDRSRERGDFADAQQTNVSSRGQSSAEAPLFEVRSGQVEAQGFSPVKNDARLARSALPEAVAENECPQRHLIGPPERWSQLLALHSAAERDLLARGLDDAHAWLPPQIARRFGRRLEFLGWLRDDRWTPYCKILHR